MASGRRAWHTLPLADVARVLDVDPAVGLGHGEARRRLERFGPNAVETGRRLTLAGTLGRQLAEPMVLVLLAVAVLALLSGQRHDAVAIGAIILVNAARGTIQEYRA